VAEKIKLNKNTLREQRDALKLFQEFLPTLELRKQQLQAEVRTLKLKIAEEQKKLDAVLQGAATWAGILGSMSELAQTLVKIDEVQVESGNIAGVRIPVFRDVKFSAIAYSLIATTPALDAVIAFWKAAVSQREQLGVLNKQLEMLDRELTKTTQRINLYEKVLIPECKENIRRIKVYLGDQQTAAVCRAKIAKAKLVAKSEAEAAGAAVAAAAAGREM